MSSGPDKPKTDYKSLWDNYSTWLREAKATFNKTSVKATASFGAKGVFGATPKLVEQNIETDYQKEISSIRSGVVAKQLFENYTSANVKAVAGPQLDRDAPYDPTKVKTEYVNVNPLTPGSPDYKKYFDLFKAETGLEPQPWEVYYLAEFGFGKNDKSDTDKKSNTVNSKRIAAANIVETDNTQSPWI